MLLYDLTSTYIEDQGEEIPTEEILAEMRDPKREVFYLVGTPWGKIQQYEKKWLDLPWQKVRLLWKLRDLRRKGPARDQLSLRIGAAKTEAGRAFGFVRLRLPEQGEAVTRQTLTFRMDQEKLTARRAGGSRNCQWDTGATKSYD